MIKNKKSPTKRHKITTAFGYSLFGLMAVAFLFTTIFPMAQALLYPGARQANIIILVSVLAISLFLPALAAYFAGDSSTRSKKASLHHYNGVLFGFAAYWLVMLLSWFDFRALFGVDQSYPTSMVAANLPPVVITLGIMIILALVFAKNQKTKVSVLHFLPYQLVLLVSVLGVFMAPYLVPGMGVTFADISVLLVPLAVVAIAYAVLGKQGTSGLARISDALIAMSIGWIAVLVADSFFSLLRLPYPAAGLASSVTGLIVLAAYLYVRARK